MNIFIALFLGLVQGLTEYLPISSSAHLIIFPRLFNWPENSLAFDVFLHIGTLLAILIYFRKKILSMIRSLLSGEDESNQGERHTVTLLIISTLFIVPLFLIINKFGSIFHEFSIITIIMLIGFGIPMIFIDSAYKRNKKHYATMTLRAAAFIGFAQSLAQISGVSRSGITIMAAMVLGLKKDQAKEYSFLVSIPVILASVVFELIDIMKTPINESMQMIFAGIVASFIGGYLAIHFLMNYLNNHSLAIFGYYRIILAIILILLFFI
jgi:undecaprenyl-diphosphatase